MQRCFDKRVSARIIMRMLIYARARARGNIHCDCKYTSFTLMKYARRRILPNGTIRRVNEVSKSAAIF